MTADTQVKSGPLAQFTFPRTGKRGVPQQFPRRLYEMLDSESRQLEISPKHPKVITWSDSGRAFCIFDVAEFSNVVLPKYFRTKKFSSFQRNLNLYGFTKVRRGPGSNVYAHPSFIRENPESLLHLRKTTAGARNHPVNTGAAGVKIGGDGMVSVTDDKPLGCSRPVSPSFSETSAPPSPKTTENTGRNVIVMAPGYPHCGGSVDDKGGSLTRSSHERGNLDLLALALEREFSG